MKECNYLFCMPNAFLDSVREAYPEEQAQELIKWLTEEPIETPIELFRIHEEVPLKAKREELYNEFFRRLDWYFEECEFEEKSLK